MLSMHFTFKGMESWYYLWRNATDGHSRAQIAVQQPHRELLRRLENSDFQLGR